MRSIRNPVVWAYLKTVPTQTVRRAVFANSCAFSVLVLSGLICTSNLMTPLNDPVLDHVLGFVAKSNSNGWSAVGFRLPPKRAPSAKDTATSRKEGRAGLWFPSFSVSHKHGVVTFWRVPLFGVGLKGIVKETVLGGPSILTHHISQDENVASSLADWHLNPMRWGLGFRSTGGGEIGANSQMVSAPRIHQEEAVSQQCLNMLKEGLSQPWFVPFPFCSAIMIFMS